jgi:hypothetical protein
MNPQTKEELKKEFYEKFTIDAAISYDGLNIEPHLIFDSRAQVASPQIVWDWISEKMEEVLEKQEIMLGQRYLRKVRMAKMSKVCRKNRRIKRKSNRKKIIKDSFDYYKRLMMSQ